MNTTVAEGVVHKMPADLKKELLSSPQSLTAWNSLTPLARNEWICWVESVKKEETRNEHIQRALIELEEGKRRPCCWIGCIHRTDKPVSRSQQYILSQRSKKNS